MTLAITPSILVLVANSVTASDAAAEATDAANAATDAANLAAEAADSTTSALQDRIDSALALANSAGIATIIDISSGITTCNNAIVSATTKRDFAKNRYDQIQIILSDVTLESSIKRLYTSASSSWLSVTRAYQSIITKKEGEKSRYTVAQSQINSIATNKAAADKAAADKAAADKAAADAKAVADAKAAADKAAADKAAADKAADKAAADKAADKAAADKAAADKAAADKAAADKAAADKAAADKAAAEKDAAIAALTAKVTAIEAKLAATKKTTITCVKGKLSKKVTAVKPKCPTGYKLKK